MIQVTALDKYYSTTNQDTDEMQAILSDLERNPGDYLSHSDPLIRSFADWTLEYFGLRITRRLPLDYLENRNAGQAMLMKLHHRLRLVACGPWTVGF